MELTYLTHSGDDLLVVNAARVSFAKESKELSSKDAKLIHYLAEHKHCLPFRHPTVTFRCKAPLFVARQLGKHQVGFSWSEESRRYISSQPEFYFPDKWRKKADNVKQGSLDEPVDNEEYVADIYTQVLGFIRAAYTELLDNGVAPEQARLVFPSCAMINWVWTGSLLGWAQLYRERSVDSAQVETREFVKLIGKEMEKLFPVSWTALLG